MTEAKPTPGPWTLFNSNGVIAVMKGKKAVVQWGGFDATDFPDHALANARLISTAPDMLAALKAMVRHFGVLEHKDMVHPVAKAASKKARSAIAKAEAKP